MVKIIYQQVTEDGKFLLGLEGLSSDTKPTGGVIADGSTFKETDTDGEYYLDTTWKVAKAGQMKNLPTVSVSDNGKIPKVIEGAWGLGTDETGGSSYTLPTASASTQGGVKIGSGLSMDGEVLSATGGAEKFVVTLTSTTVGDKTTWTADKTLAEIAEAYEDGQAVVANYPDVTLGNLEIPILTINGQEGFAVFGATFMPQTETISLSIVGFVDGDSTDWNASQKEIAEVPSYSSSNNGQVLGVSSGSLAWVDAVPAYDTTTDAGKVLAVTADGLAWVTPQ